MGTKLSRALTSLGWTAKDWWAELPAPGATASRLKSYVA
jgi:hypothetical protein